MESDVKNETKFENFDYEIYFKDNPIAHSKQNRFEKSRELLKDPTIFKGKLRFVERVEYGECPECHSSIKLSDYWCGELVCKGCGLVLNDQMATLPDHELMQHTSTDKLETGSKVTNNEKRALRKAGKKVINHTDMKEWRKSSYILAVDTATNEFMMPRHQKRYIQEIIDKYGIRKFHGWLNADAVILGLCMCQLRSNGRLINFQGKYTRKVGLNKEHYAAIERKTKQLHLFD